MVVAETPAKFCGLLSVEARDPQQIMVAVAQVTHREASVAASGKFRVNGTNATASSYENYCLHEEELMYRNRSSVVCLIFTLILTLGTPRSMYGGDKTSYPSMAALDQYLMADRNAEI